MVKTRRLADLYQRGKEVTFDDGEHDPETIWVQKLNPIEMESVLRSSNAARAKVLATARNGQEDELNALLYRTERDFDSQEGCIRILVAHKMVDVALSIESEISARDEWSDKNYLQGLRDCWNDGLDKTYGENPEEPEAKRVHDELERYTEAVKTEIEARQAQWEIDYKERPLEWLREQAREEVLKSEADGAWVTEFRSQELLFAVRDKEDHKQKYFTDRAELDSLASEVLVKLVETYQQLMVDPLEGKDSQRTPDSSSSSAQPELEVVPDPSIPEVVSAF